MSERESILASACQEESKLRNYSRKQIDYTRLIEAQVPNVNRNPNDEKESFGKGWLVYLDWSRKRKITQYETTNAQYEDLLRFVAHRPKNSQGLEDHRKTNVSEKRKMILTIEMSALLKEIQALVKETAQVQAQRKKALRQRQKNVEAQHIRV